jgi:hypothetical protein
MPPFASLAFGYHLLFISFKMQMQKGPKLRLLKAKAKVAQPKRTKVIILRVTVASFALVPAAPPLLLLLLLLLLLGVSLACCLLLAAVE